MKKIYLPSQSYFITTNIADREWIFSKKDNGVYIPNDKLCQIIINVFNYSRGEYKFFLHGYVILPDHLHFILTITGDESAVTRVSVVGDESPVTQAKSAGIESPATWLEGNTINSHRAGDDLSNNNRVGGDSSPPIIGNISQIMHAIKGRSARLINKELGLLGQFWQHDFYEHGIRNEKDFEEKLNYIHQNPVKANLVKNLADFKYSSYRNYYLDDESVIKIDKIEL